MIEGVKVTPLRIISDERGMVMHMLRSDSETFVNFGEVYFSVVNPDKVKGWKFHKERFQNMVVPSGMIKLVIFDDREGSKTKGAIYELEIGSDNYQLVFLPPQIWYGFKGISNGPSIIANLADKPHDPKESITKDLSDPSIPYKW